MPTFEFADCPTVLNLAAAPGSPGDQVGSVRCTLRNTSSRRQVGRIHIKPLGAAQPGWFSLDGAAVSSPLEVEQDVDAGGTLTVSAKVRVPPGAPAGTQNFLLRVTSEAAPDTDFAEGPAISFNVAASKEPETKKAPFPWWAMAVALALLLFVGAAVAYLLWPTPLNGRLVKLANPQTQKCLTIDGGNPLDNVLAVQAACGDDPFQQWTLTEVQPERFEVRNVKSGRCLTIAGGVSTENNVPALQYRCDGDPSRSWKISKVAGDGAYQFVNGQTQKCLSANDANAAVQFDCDTERARRWTLAKP